MIKLNKKGFTLIELLVVIAIIGILSSVVLASLNTARGRGSDAKVKSQLAGARAGAELYFDSNNGYGVSTMAAPALPCTGAMFIDSGSGLLQYTGTASSWPTGTTLSCQSSANAYAISASLNSSNAAATDHYCVDSAGNSRPISAQIGNGIYVCPAS